MCIFTLGCYIGFEGKLMSTTTPKRLKAKIVAKRASRRTGMVCSASASGLTGEFSSKPESGTRKKRRKISVEESVLRIERVRRGDANNRIEGISSDPESDTVFAAYINGDIEVTEIVPRLKLLYRVP
jgi:hypothetical protein